MKFPAFEPIDLKNKIDSPSVSIAQIPLSQIFPDPNQPRTNFTEASLKELAASIKQHGVIQPIIVRQLAEGHYQIIAGERRWRASCILALEVMPAIIRSEKPEDSLVIPLIENIQREGLNPIELAKAFHRLHQEHAFSHETIAEMVGKSRVAITNTLRLLNLAHEVQILLIENKLEMGHARSLLTLMPEQQIHFANIIVGKEMTVRAAEQLVQNHKQALTEKKAPYSNEVSVWVKRLSSSLSSKVAIDINKKGQGKVIIHFGSPMEADWLVNHFTNSLKTPELE